MISISADEVSTPETLRIFLEAMRCRAPGLDDNETDTGAPDPSALKRFFAAFAPLNTGMMLRGDLINFWEVSGIGTNEVRNASVLRWFFDPDASHGLGKAPLETWLGDLMGGRADLPLPLPGRFTAQTETYPLANEHSRVDIEIAGAEFLLIVEVKVLAAEGPDQVRRYLDLAQTKAARTVPYLVVFISPAVPERLSSGIDDHVIATTWMDVASSFRRLVASKPLAERGRAHELLTQFAEHVSRF